MPMAVESPARLSRVLPIALLAHICTGAWLTSASVYYSAIVGIPIAKIAPAVASGAIGLSYLVSVLLATRTSLRDLRIALALVAGGLILQASWPWAGSAIAIIGFGLLRPAMLGVVGRSSPNRLRAFQHYTIVINLGYLLGGFLADAVRLSVGYFWLLLVLGSLAAVALLGSIWLGPSESIAPELPREPVATKPALAVSLLGSVAMFYFLMSLVATILSLVAEYQTSLKAGSLGGLHGGLVLLITLALVTKPSVEPILSLVLGLGLWGLALGGLAATRTPVPLGVLVTALILMSLGESLIGPNLMALGSRLVGFGMNAYWGAATLGYWGSMVYNFGWLDRGQARHFGYVALACGVGGLTLWLVRRGRKS